MQTKDLIPEAVIWLQDKYDLDEVIDYSINIDTYGYQLTIEKEDKGTGECVNG